MLYFDSLLSLSSLRALCALCALGSDRWRQYPGADSELHLPSFYLITELCVSSLDKFNFRDKKPDALHVAVVQLVEGSTVDL
jgi:hypothetical protein